MLLLCLCVLFALPLFASRHGPTAPQKHLVLASYRLSSSQHPDLREDTDIVTIEADTLRTSDARPEALQSAIAAIEALSGERGVPTQPSGAQPSYASNNARPKWLAWSRLDAPAMELRTVGAVRVATDAIQAYAAHPPGGAAMCLVNHSDQKLTTHMRIRLPRGVYKIDRLLFTPAVIEHASEAASTQGAPILRNEARLDPLEGCDLASTGVVAKTLTLNPGEVCLVRVTDVALQSWRAWCETQSALHGLEGEASGPARRLLRMLAEVSGGLGGLTGGHKHSNTNTRLRKIHALLLGTAQAESLARNYLTRRVFSALPGQKLMSALVSLSENLAETSATLLGLSSRVDVTYTQNTDAQSAPTGEVHHAVVTIRLENTGSRSVGLVKMGLNASLLPEGARCEPADLAFFGTLHPGQTVQAEFHVEQLPATGLTEEHCVADISYFTANVPAHLRTHAWF